MDPVDLAKLTQGYRLIKEAENLKKLNQDEARRKGYAETLSKLEAEKSQILFELNLKAKKLSSLIKAKPLKQLDVLRAFNNLDTEYDVEWLGPKNFQSLEFKNLSKKIDDFIADLREWVKINIDEEIKSKVITEQECKYKEEKEEEKYWEDKAFEDRGGAEQRYEEIKQTRFQHATRIIFLCALVFLGILLIIKLVK